MPTMCCSTHGIEKNNIWYESMRSLVCWNWLYPHFEILQGHVSFCALIKALYRWLENTWVLKSNLGFKPITIGKNSFKFAIVFGVHLRDCCLIDEIVQLFINATWNVIGVLANQINDFLGQQIHILLLLKILIVILTMAFGAFHWTRIPVYYEKQKGNTLNAKSERKLASNFITSKNGNCDYKIFALVIYWMAASRLSCVFLIHGLELLFTWLMVFIAIFR